MLTSIWQFDTSRYFYAALTFNMHFNKKYTNMTCSLEINEIVGCIEIISDIMMDVAHFFDIKCFFQRVIRYQIKMSTTKLGLLMQISFNLIQIYKLRFIDSKQKLKRKLFRKTTFLACWLIKARFVYMTQFFTPAAYFFYHRFLLNLFTRGSDFIVIYLNSLITKAFIINRLLMKSKRVCHVKLIN